MTVMKHFALILLAALTWSVSAQIELTQDLAPEALVEGVLEGEGVDAFNVSYSGSLSQIAVMGNGSSLGIPLDDAVIISTGHALAAECDAYGLEDGLGQVNDSLLLEVANSVPGLIGQSFNVSSVNDVASLEFDFIPADDQFGFAFVFASKEYGVYENTAFNDVFAFFIDGPGIGEFEGDVVNMATIPNTMPPLPITVSSVNGQINQEWFGGSLDVTCSIGITSLIPATQQVVPGETYHIRLAIADGSDSSYDSWVGIGEFSSGELGCTDESACNFDASAVLLDASCVYPEPFYDCDGNCLLDTDEDGVCDELEIAGCMDEGACNFDPEATDDDGSCDIPLIAIDGGAWMQDSVFTVYCDMIGDVESVDWSFEPFGIVDIISMDGDSVVLMVNSPEVVTITASVMLTDQSSCEGQLSWPELPDVIVEGAQVLPIRIVPNPANDVLSLGLIQTTVQGKVELWSLSGQSMVKAHWTRGQTQMTLDVSSIPSGMYLLASNLNGHQRMQRVVIQH